VSSSCSFTFICHSFFFLVYVPVYSILLYKICEIYNCHYFLIYFVVYKVNIVLLFCFKLSSFLPLYILLIDWMAMVQYLVEALGSFSLIACSEWL